MTDEQATATKDICGEGYTLRAVARYAHENFSSSWRLGWSIPGDQGVGIAVCGAAVHVLGGDPDTGTWWP